MLRIIDELLNKITMYRLTLYYLITVVSFAFISTFFGFLPYKAADLLISSIILIVACYISNFVFAKIFKAVTNFESVFITSLILVLIIPIKFPDDIAFVVLAGVIAMGAKYLLAVNKSHIFNPAAVSVIIIYLIFNQSASWWVGTPIMLPITVAGGLLVMRKTQRENLIFNFLMAFLVILGVGVFLRTDSLSLVISAWDISLFHSALLFFAFVMLTEPLTSPATKKLRGFFGYFVAVLYAVPEFRLISFVITPEMALCIGNVFSHIVSPNYRFNLLLKTKKQLSRDSYEFVFDKQKDLNFLPGQYMEWTLPHKNMDSRGNRRYFSLSSSPTENEVAIGVKFYAPSSSYKRELLNLQDENLITASQVAGDFVLPKNLKEPLVFIAGGIGITPFRSMISYIINKNLQVDLILIYSNKTEEDILYKDIFDKAKLQGVKTIYNLTDLNSVPPDWQGTTGYITKESIQNKIPDFRNRAYYLSGPQLMVQNFERTLHEAGVSKSKIKTDFFPGYAEM